MAGKKRLITQEQTDASKAHRRAWDRARHAKDKEKRNAARRAAHAKNPERIRKIERERYAANPHSKKKNGVRSKYGEAAYEAFLTIHNCESCGDAIAGRTKHIDHNHARPRSFRGILCNNCNIALGYLKEDERRIIGLLNYLKSKENKDMTKYCTDRPMAQGDLLIIPIKTIPANAKPATVQNGHYIVAHSETGHHHVIERARAEVYEAADDTFIAYVKTLGDGAEITHKRDFHTHETIGLSPNQTYEIRRQREYVPQGFRKAQD